MSDYTPSGVLLAAVKAGISESSAHDLADIVRNARAEAWEEGARAAYDGPGDELSHRWLAARNPYREAQS